MNNPFDKLKEIKPGKQNSLEPQESRVVDEIASSHGFIKDAVEPVKRLRRGSEGEPTTASVSMRVHISSWNVFVAWCEEERLPYRKGFDILLKKAGMI